MKSNQQQLHLGLLQSIEINNKYYYTVILSAVISFMVRILSYYDAGMYYGATAVISAFGLYLFLFLIPSVRSGRKTVFYRRDYLSARTLFVLAFNTFLISLGTFTGNTIYYLNRYRVWEDSSQLLRMFQDLMNPAGFLIGILISYLIYRYFFLQDKFIDSREYAGRLYLKVMKEGMPMWDAHRAVIQEKDLFHLYGIVLKNNEGQSVAPLEEKPEKKRKSLKKTNGEDIYAEARMRRGAK